MPARVVLLYVAVSCGRLEAPQRGIMAPVPGEEDLFHYGIVKNFTCNRGFYRREGTSQSRTCQVNGQWSGKQTECAGRWAC